MCVSLHMICMMGKLRFIQPLIFQGQRKPRNRYSFSYKISNLSVSFVSVKQWLCCHVVRWRRGGWYFVTLSPFKKNIIENVGDTMTAHWMHGIGQEKKKGGKSQRSWGGKAGVYSKWKKSVAWAGDTVGREFNWNLFFVLLPCSTEKNIVHSSIKYYSGCCN